METLWQAIANLGFAIAVGGFLVYWVVTSVNKKLDSLINYQAEHNATAEIQTKILDEVLSKALNGKKND